MAIKKREKNTGKDIKIAETKYGRSYFHPIDKPKKSIDNEEERKCVAHL